jgi:hypothetical protein
MDRLASAAAAWPGSNTIWLHAIILVLHLTDSKSAEGMLTARGGPEGACSQVRVHVLIPGYTLTRGLGGISRQVV